MVSDSSCRAVSAIACPLTLGRIPPFVRSPLCRPTHTQPGSRSDPRWVRLSRSLFNRGWPPEFHLRRQLKTGGLPCGDGLNAGQDPRWPEWD